MVEQSKQLVLVNTLNCVSVSVSVSAWSLLLLLLERGRQIIREIVNGFCLLYGTDLSGNLVKLYK